MAEMYPDDQTIELFGESIKWPSLDPNTGKFTNGSFSDPLEKPSFIPAETINLILDNLAELIKSAGETPNNNAINQLASLFTSAAVAKKGIIRDAAGRAKVAAPEAGDDIVCLSFLNQITNNISKPPLFIPTPIFNDDDLVAGYLGTCAVCNGSTYNWASYPEANNTRFKSFLDKYSANYGANKSTNGGLSFKMPDFAGLSIVSAGTNTVVKIKDKDGNDTVNYYDGNNIGSILRDAIRNAIGQIAGGAENTAWNPWNNGVFNRLNYQSIFNTGTSWAGSKYELDLSRSIPTANNIRVASVPVLWVVRVA